MRNPSVHIAHSQNFLQQDGLVTELIDASSLEEQDTVVEIGGGSGIITRALANKCKRVIVYELDRRWAMHLSETLHPMKHVQVVYGDFLAHPLPTTYAYKIFANPPFNQTAAILHHLSSAENPPIDTFLILQKQAAYKYTGQPVCSESLRSLLLKPRFEPRVIRALKPNDFKPQPSVETVFWQLQLRSTSEPSDEFYADLITTVLKAPGTTIKARFRKILSYQQLKRLGHDLGFQPNQSIRVLDYEQWQKLYQWIKQYVSPDKKAAISGAYGRLEKQQGQITKRHRHY